MDSTYREIAPSARLAAFVECYWTGGVLESHAARILPDGCADIVFFARRNELIGAQIVGVMTRTHTVQLEADTRLLGIRFQPGMAGVFLRGQLRAFNNLSVPLGPGNAFAADGLVRAAGRSRSIEDKVVALEKQLSDLPKIDRFQQAILELVARKGEMPVQDFAAAAKVGQRQLRRACIKHSGLGPKQLARILRFRRAIGLLRRGEFDATGVALECGYYDQAHMILDFRELAGTSPGRLDRMQTG
jgi:AraC-like DNA-binding protein